jgi:hypothetical protein
VLFYLAFPLLFFNWTRAKAQQTAETFLSDLNRGDYESAQRLIKSIRNGISAEYLAEIPTSFENPRNRPLSWDLETTGGSHPWYAVTGTVTLPDNREIPIAIHTEWVWETASWTVSGVRQEKYLSTTDEAWIDFIAEGTDLGALLDLTPVLIYLASVYISGKYLFGLYRALRMKIPFERGMVGRY